MEKYYRLVIEILKEGLSDVMSSGEIDRENALKGLRTLQIEVDRREVVCEPVEELKALENDLFWLLSDLTEEKEK